MPNEVSVDEFLAKRKDYVKSNGVLMKAAKAPTTWNDEERSARFVMTNELPDRDRDIVMQAGLDWTNFLKNPVAPFSHRSRDFPVGNWGDIKLVNGSPKHHEGTLKFVPEGGDPDADRAAFHVKHGSIRACSIGFMPKKLRQRERDENDAWSGYEILEAEVVEASLTPIPAVPGALAKSLDGEAEHKLAREIIEEICDTWVKHPETGLYVPYADFVAAYKELTGNKTVSVSLKHAVMTSDEVENIVSKSNDTMFDRFKKFFAKEEKPAPEPVAPKLATVESKAAVAARMTKYREARASS